jgi:thiol-disulfide isomerase/thioredoxin
MKQLQATLLLLSALVSPALAGPDVIEAEDFSLADHEGQVVLLDFWAGWCQPCLEALPWLGQLQERHGDDGLRVIAVNVDRRGAAPTDVIGELPPGLLVVMDPDRQVSRPYRLRGLPTTLLIDREGRTRARETGYDPRRHGKWEQLIVRLLAGEQAPRQQDGPADR